MKKTQELGENYKASLFLLYIAEQKAASRAAELCHEGTITRE
jgi:hypothetical protein